MSAEGKKKDKGFIALLVLIIVCACLMIAAVTTLGVGMSQGFGGSEGPTGEQTMTASQWFSGDGVPSGNTGKKGDFYLNKQNGDVYEKTADGWQLSLNIKGADADTVPRISNGENGETAGNWYIGNRDTGVKAGGSDGLTPSIGADGYWYIGGKKTEQRATHELTYENGQWYLDGDEVGEPAEVPHIGDGDKGEVDGNWYIGNKDTGIKAVGESFLPYVGKNGNWFVNGEDTHQSAGSTITITEDGTWAIDGQDTGWPVKGDRGTDGNTPYIGEDGNWYIDGVKYGPARANAYLNEDGYWVVNGETTTVSGRPMDWHSGEGDPTTEGGENYIPAKGGDFYIDTKSGAVWTYSETEGEWSKVYSAKFEFRGNEWFIDGKGTGLFATQWYTQEGAPDAQTLGYKGDYYVNLNNGDIYINEGNNADANGKSSSWKKLTNFAGGNSNVTSWQAGDGDPTAKNVKGLLGDMYLNKLNGQLYQYGLNGWAAIDGFNVTGNPAQRGTRLFSGKGDPNAAENQSALEEAAVGDYYFDTKNGVIYVYSDGATKRWEALNADDPLAGSRWVSGNVDPAYADLSSASEGDVYFNTENRTLWQLQNGKWAELGQLGEGLENRGTKWFYGTTDPTDDSFDALVKGSRNDDFYLQTYYVFSGFTGFRMYAKQGNAWNLILDMAETITADKDTQFTIPNYDALKSFRDSVNGKYTSGAKDYSGKTVTLTGAITIPKDDNDWVVGSKTKEDGTAYYVFSGIFEGNNIDDKEKTPIDLSKLEGKAPKYIEGINGTLFGKLDGATIQNLDLYGKLDTATITTNPEENALSLLKNTFGLAQVLEGSNTISNVRLTLENEVATVVVYWATTESGVGNVSVTVTGKASEVQPTAANETAANASAYALKFNDTAFTLADANYTFNNIALTGTSYFDITNTKSFALTGSYVATDNTAKVENPNIHNAPIYGGYNGATGSAGFTLENNVFDTPRAAYIYNNIKEAKIKNNSFGTADQRRMADEWAVKFMNIADGATFDITDNEVYGATEAKTATADNDFFYAFDFYSAANNNKDYSVKLGKNTVNVTDGAKGNNFGIIKVESQTTTSGTDKTDNGAKGKIYFLGNENTLNGESKLYNAVAFETYDDTGARAKSENSFSFIAFDAEFGTEESNKDQLVKGNVYIGSDFGKTHNAYTAENLKNGNVVASDAQNNVCIIDLAYKEDPTGFVQHVADYTTHYYLNNEQGYLYFQEFIAPKEGEPTYAADMTFAQTADLDMDVVSSLATEAGWTASVGTSKMPFKATYDGQNHTISNLKSSLFGYTEGATIQNLTLNKVEITGEKYVGALIGVAQAETTTNTTVENVAVKDADLILNGTDTPNSLSLGAIAGAADGITLKAVSAENVILDNKTASAAQGVYNNGLVGSKYQATGATALLEAATVKIEVGTTVTGQTNFTASFQGEITALSLELSASWAMTSESGTVSTAVWTVKNLDGLNSAVELVNSDKITENDTIAIGENLDLSTNTTWQGIGSEGHAFKGTFTGVKLGEENGAPVYSKIDGLSGALFNNLTGNVKNITLVFKSLTKTVETVNGLVATKVSGTVGFDGVAVSTNSESVKANDLAAAPYALYSGVATDATITVKNTKIVLGLTSEKIDFSAEIDGEGVANVSFKGTSATLNNEVFTLQGFDKHIAAPAKGVGYTEAKYTEAYYAFEGIKFTGSSYLDIAYASGLTMKNCEADVSYSAVKDESDSTIRYAFIRSNKSFGADGAFGSLKLDIENNKINVSTLAASADKTNTMYPNAIYVMWNAIQNGSVIKGNTLGSKEKPLPHDAIKLSEFASDAVITIEKNTIYGTTEQGDFTAFNFVQAYGKEEKPATLKLNGNTVYVVTEKPNTETGENKPATVSTGYKFMLLQIEGYYDKKDSEVNAYAYYKTYLDAKNKIFTGKKLLNNSVTYAAQGADVKYEDIHIDAKDFGGSTDLENELALFVGYNVMYNENGKLSQGNFVFGQDNGGNTEMFKSAITELYSDVEEGAQRNMHIVIGNDFGRNLADFKKDGTSNDTTPYYIYSNPTGLDTFRTFVEGGKDDFNGKTVMLDLGNTQTLDLSDYTGENAWEPIGTDDNPFKGTFDGTFATDADGNKELYSIEGLTYTGKAQSFGFFGNTDGATIKNVIFSGASITMNDYNVKTSDNYVGIVVAEATSTTFENVLVSGSTIEFKGSTEQVEITIKTTDAEGNQQTRTGKVTVMKTPNVEAVGAVAGLANGGTFSNIVVQEGVTITSNGANVGGVVGKAQGEVTLTNLLVGVLADAENSGKFVAAAGAEAVTLTGTAAVGGVVGIFDAGTSARVTVGAVSESIVYVGASVNAVDVYNDTFLKIGGIIGYVPSSATGSTTELENVNFLGTLSRKTFETSPATSLIETDKVTTQYAFNGMVGSDKADANNVTIKNSEINSTPVAGYTQNTTWNNAGAATSVSYISNADGLEFFAQQVNGGKDYTGEIVQLTADIDLAGKAWTPIGTKDHLFNGTFTGLHGGDPLTKGKEIEVGGKATGYYFNALVYTISNLNVQTHDSHGGKTKVCTEGNYAGLFGAAGDDAMFEFINIDGATVNGSERVGTLVGSANGASFCAITIANATLNGHHFVGGLTGHATKAGTISYIQIVGLNAAAYPNATESTKIDNGDDVGGLVGYIGYTAGLSQAPEHGKTLSNNVVAESTLKAYRDVGGLVGTDNVNAGAKYTSNTIKNVTISIVQSNFKAEGYELGDVATYGDGDGTAKEQHADWLVGRSIGNSDVNREEATTTNNVRENVTVIHNGFVEDNGVSHISDIVTFDEFVKKADTITADKTVVLDCDLDLNGHEFSPITGFKGTFDGANHTIKNVTIEISTAATAAGLFADLQGTVQNLNLEAINITATGATAAVGALAGTATGATISNVTLNGATITANGANAVAGGLIGRATATVSAGKKTSLTNVTLGGAIAVTVQNDGTEGGKVASGTAGGLIGEVTGATTLAQIVMNATSLQVSGAVAGGVIGEVTANLTVSNNTEEGKYGVEVAMVDVINATTAGLFAGKMSDGTGSNITDVSIKGSVTAADAAAGFIGVLNTSAMFSDITVNGTVNATKEAKDVTSESVTTHTPGGEAAGFATYGESVSTSTTITNYNFYGKITSEDTTNVTYLVAADEAHAPTFTTSRVVITDGDAKGDTDGFFFGATTGKDTEASKIYEGKWFVETFTMDDEDETEVNGLAAFATALNSKTFEGEEVVLLGDIELTAWTAPTGTFKGTFNGNNMTITLTTAEGATETYTTLFGTVEGKMVPQDPIEDEPQPDKAEYATINNLKLSGLAVAKTLKIAKLNSVTVTLKVSAAGKALYGLAEKADDETVVKESSITVNCTDYDAKFSWDEDGDVTGDALSAEPADNTVAFIVNTPDGLIYLASVVNSGIDYAGKTVKIGNNVKDDAIDLAGKVWTPIGGNVKKAVMGQDEEKDVIKSYEYYTFKGTFDGNSKTIKNLTMTAPAAAAAAETPDAKPDTFAGLFGYITGGTVKDLTIEGVSLNANAMYTGAIAGKIGKTIDGTGATLENITVKGSTVYVSSSMEGAYLGGIAGYMEDVTLSETVTVTGNDNTATASVAAASTAGNNSYVGGIAGYVKGITSISAELKVTGMMITGSANAGGLFGAVEGKTALNAKATFSGRIEGANGYNAETQGLVGTLVGESTFNCSAYEVTLTEGDGFETKFEKTAEQDAKQPVIVIGSVAGLNRFRDQLAAGKTYKGYTVTLTYDVYVMGEIEPNGGTFEGTFAGKLNDGNKPVIIYSMNVTSGIESQVGFFGKLNGATVSNLVFRNVTIDAPNAIRVGIVAADSNGGAISGVTIEGSTSVKGGTWVGGLVGHAVGTEFTSNTINGTETNPIELEVQNYKLGGIAGYLSAGSVGAENGAGNTLNYVTLTALARSVSGGDDGYGMIGGLIGGGESTSETSISGNTLTNVLIDATQGDADYQKYTGALVGNPGGGTISGNTGTVTIEIGIDTPYTEKGLVGAANHSNCTVNNDNTLKVVWDGIVVVENGIEVTNKEGLLWFANSVNKGHSDYTGKTVTLTSDIDLAGESWTPIGTSEKRFVGTFDGVSNTIKNLKVTGEENVGFFGVLAGTVQNLKFTNATVKAPKTETAAGTCVGILAGKTILDHTVGEPKIDNVSITDGEVSGKEYVATLVGQIGEVTTITNCKISGTKLSTNKLHFVYPAYASTEALKEAVEGKAPETQEKPDVHVNSLVIGGNSSGKPTTIYNDKNVCTEIELTVELAATDSLADVLSIVNAENESLKSTHIKLAAGTYTATANDLFVITANNVTLEGTLTGGDDKVIGTTINGSTFSREGLGSFVVTGNNVTIKNVNITSTNNDDDVPALKVAGTVSNSVAKPVTGFTLENAKVTATSGNAIDLHTVENATISNVTVTGYTKCGIALAQATVSISGMTFTAGTNSWAEIGIMYEANDANYTNASTVTVDFTKTFNFTNATTVNRKATIYSERPTSATADKLYNGTVAVDKTHALTGWTWSERTEGTPAKEAGWKLVKD